MKNYKISEMGQKFLAVMEIKRNYKDLRDPSIKDFADLTKSYDDKLDKQNVKESFYFSVWNPHHHPRMAKEITEKLFTSTEESKLRELLEDLKKEDDALITSANSEVRATIERGREETFPGDTYGLKKMEVGIVCEIFERISTHALNLLGLIKIKPEHFPQSYTLLEQMLKDFNERKRDYDQSEIKGIFTKALQELETLVEKSKEKKKKPEEKETPSNPKKNPEKQKNPNDDQKPNKNDKPDLTLLKNESVSAIKIALNQTPLLTNADLSPEHQDWENRISNLSEEGQINLLKNRILMDIQDRRNEKIKNTKSRDAREIINSNLQNAQSPESTIQDKEKALADNEKYEGQVVYEDAKVKEKTKNLKKEIARAKFYEYLNKVISDLDAKLKRNHLKEKDLEKETQNLIQELRNQKITDPSQLVETEIKITQAIFKEGAAKKIITFKKWAKNALKSNDETKINELKKELNEFIKSNNVYYQAKKMEARKLLEKLESHSTTNNSHTSESLPFSGQIGIGLGAVLVVAFLTLLIWKKTDRYLNLNKTKLIWKGKRNH
ncbi:MAG: hypothetical protein MRERC_1c143 [Mycoplasmataceae bacterium RC_NB112A]|nr:MAG: hypothetical protein MRERC_1c143 [Mycoplasmataceae bacterium RC_NB112A]